MSTRYAPGASPAATFHVTAKERVVPAVNRSSSQNRCRTRRPATSYTSTSTRADRSTSALTRAVIVTEPPRATSGVDSRALVVNPPAVTRAAAAGLAGATATATTPSRTTSSVRQARASGWGVVRHGISFGVGPSRAVTRP